MNPAPSILFLDHSGPALTNAGDLAMLQVAASRLHHLLPHTRLIVPAYDPARLRAACPQVEPLDARALDLLFWRRLLPDRVRRHLPRLAAIEDTLAARHPLAALRLRACRNALRGEGHRESAQVIQILHQTHVFVAAGGGYFNDLFPGHLTRVLGVLRIARSRHRPFALLGQGLGPASNPALRHAMADILGAASAIHLREGRHSLAFLRSIAPDAISPLVTGDDAIEPAWNQRPARPGNRIGFNLRLAGYAGVDQAVLPHLRATLLAWCTDQSRRLVPCPIAFDSENGDDQAIGALLGDSPALDPAPCPDAPEAVIQRIAQCHLVVTGSYHAAVFALAQGIPVVGLVSSAYYLEKFSGLLHQFGPACAIVDLREPEFPQVLNATLDTQSTRTTSLREPTLAAAAAQIEAGRRAYARLPEVLSLT